MTPDEKPQFLRAMNELFGAHAKPLSETLIAGYWKALEKMQLVDFERCCERFIERLQEPSSLGEKRRCPDPQDLWDMRRTMRYGNTRITSAAGEPTYHGDHWDIASNHLLMRYIAQNSLKPAHERIDYAPDSHYDSVSRTTKVGRHSEAISKILNKWRAAWAQDAREGEQAGDDMDNKPNWFACMRSADAEVSNYLKQIREAA